MEKTDIQQLLEQYLEQQLDEASAARLKALLNDPAQQQEVIQALNNMVAATPADPSLVPADWNEMPGQIVAIDKRATPVRRLNTRWLAAASIIILLGLGMLWWQLNTKNKQLPKNNTAATIKDVAPGHNGAVLTLADGSTLVLDSIANDTLTTQNGTQVIIKNGQLEYQPTGTAAAETMYNTMTTPRGRQFNIRLPDGTQVWLNAASSIRYPTAFTGNTREVELEGEGYFEVAKNAAKPFHVKTGVQDIEVLGTHFNVNAYKNEGSIRTTLLEGSVKVGNRQSAIGNRQSVILKPGEQAVAVVSPLTTDPADSRHPDKVGNSPLTIDPSPNLDAVMAWKNGLFNFENAGVEEVMRQLQRWYNIEIVYTGKIKPVKFFGEINKNVPLSVVLDALKNAGVNCKLETGNKLVVMP